jgi:hypothetical protein
MVAHFSRVRTHTRLWLEEKLEGLDRVWYDAFNECGTDEGWCVFCIYARDLIVRYQGAIATNQRVNFDFTIFNYYPPAPRK